MRIMGLDITRSLAIFLAMSSHIYADVGLGTYMPSSISTPILVMLQVSTPIFVVLFGTMLEIVYFPRVQSGKFQDVAARLFLRAIQCWLLYAISIFTLFIVDDGYSLAFSISCLLFMGNSPYTEILKFYAIALAIAPLLLWMRARMGLAPLIAVAIAYQAAWPILHALPDARNDLGVPLQAARFIKFVTGFGSPSLAGPSILHGLTLIIAGQTLGRVIAGNQKSKIGGDALAFNPLTFGRRISMLLVLSFGITATIISILPEEVFSGLADMSLRMNSHVLYFTIGTSFAVLASLVFIFIADVKEVASREFWRISAFFGRTSLFTFSWGNILLYLVNYQPLTSSGTYTLAFLLLVAICLMSFVFDHIMRHYEGARFALVAVNRPLENLSRLPFSAAFSKS